VVLLPRNNDEKVLFDIQKYYHDYFHFRIVFIVPALQPVVWYRKYRTVKK